MWECVFAADCNVIFYSLPSFACALCTLLCQSILSLLTHRHRFSCPILYSSFSCMINTVFDPQQQQECGHMVYTMPDVQSQENSEEKSTQDGQDSHCGCLETQFGVVILAHVLHAKHYKSQTISLCVAVMLSTLEVFYSNHMTTCLIAPSFTTGNARRELRKGAWTPSD